MFVSQKKYIYKSDFFSKNSQKAQIALYFLVSRKITRQLFMRALHKGFTMMQEQTNKKYDFFFLFENNINLLNNMQSLRRIITKENKNISNNVHGNHQQ